MKQDYEDERATLCRKVKHNEKEKRISTEIENMREREG